MIKTALISIALTLSIFAKGQVESIKDEQLLREQYNAKFIGKTLEEALRLFDKPVEKVAVVEGLGCSSPGGYFNFYLVPINESACAGHPQVTRIALYTYDKFHWKSEETGADRMKWTENDLSTYGKLCVTRVRIGIQKTVDQALKPIL